MSQGGKGGTIQNGHYKPAQQQQAQMPVQGGGAQGYGGNIMNNSAMGMQDMFRMLQQAQGSIGQGYGYSPVTGQAQGFQAAQSQAHGYDPAMAQGTGYNAAQGSAQGYNPAQMQAANYQAALQNNPAAIHSQMGNYQNQWDDEVVGRTTDNMQRSLQEMQERNAAQASAAGAFGGSRHGLVEATTNSEALRGIGDMTAQLRQQGFNTAAGLAGQDIGNQINVAGMNQNAQNQAGQFNAGNMQQANMANMGAQNEAGSFLANARNLMSQFNTGEQNQARQFGAANQMQANLANQQSQNQAGQFNAGAQNQNSQFNAGNRQQANMFGADARNNMSQFNAGQINQAGQFNAGASQQRTQDLMQLANQYGNAGQAAYGIGSNIQDRQSAQGAQQQAMMQNILNSSQGLWDQYTGNPQNILQMLLGATGQSPLGQANTTSQTQPRDNTLLPNLIGAAGNMFQFAPIALSSARFKHDVQPTGRMVVSVDGHATKEVTFRYLPELDPSQGCYTGIIAEDLGKDSAVIFRDGKPYAVDYSKLEVVE